MRTNVLKASLTLLSLIIPYFTLSQTISGCDFFPDQETVTYTYTEPSAFGITNNEVTYEFQGNKTINGKTYKAYNKYVNGMVPEVNQVLYVSCANNSLIMGNEIYVFNKELIGYEQDITKIIDIYATPIYEVSMVPTGQFYLPTVIKPNNSIGEVWTEKSAMHGQIVTNKNSILEKDITVEVQGRTFEHVYVVSQETWSESGINGNQKILDAKIYYAKGLGMIKTEKTTTIFKNTTTTELYNPNEKAALIAQIEQLKDSLPVESGFNINMKNYVESQISDKDNFLKVLKEIRNQLREIKNNYHNNLKGNELKEKEYEIIKNHILANEKTDKSLLGTWKKTIYTSDIRKGTVKKEEHLMFEILENGTMSGHPDNDLFKINGDDKFIYRLKDKNHIEILSNYNTNTNTYLHEVYYFTIEPYTRIGPKINMSLTFTNDKNKYEKVLGFYSTNNIYRFFKSQKN
ncbi:hypothetical protein [Gaetbulibacter jejuensis]|uniref:Uncharacterized protein n=1 Tax=Gaetbulibacter jejuensis TaxID=584607 RepID=A0ABP3VA92_9FLAO